MLHEWLPHTITFLTLGRNALGVARDDQTVGVGRIGDDQHFDRLLGVLVERLTLTLVDLRVALEQIAALHVLRALARRDQYGHVDVLEGLRVLVGGYHRVEQRKGAVLELVLDALQSPLVGRLLEQMQDDRLRVAEHAATRERAQQRVGHLASRTAHQHTQRLRLGHSSPACSISRTK